MTLQRGSFPHEVTPAQDHCHLVGLHDGDSRYGVQECHDGDPPVHPLPQAIQQSGQRRCESAYFGGGAEFPHRDSLLWSREKGSESVRRINEVSPVTSLSKESSERVKR